MRCPGGTLYLCVLQHWQSCLFLISRKKAFFLGRSPSCRQPNLFLAHPRICVAVGVRTVIIHRSISWAGLSLLFISFWLWFFFFLFQLPFGVSRAFPEQSRASWSMLCGTMPSNATGKSRDRTRLSLLSAGMELGHVRRSHSCPLHPLLVQEEIALSLLIFKMLPSIPY